MIKSKTLIITGWDSGHVYAHAAALALLRYPEARVQGASRARLAEQLEQATGFDEIFILGVALDGSPERLATAVNDLTGKGIKLHWFSDRPAPKSIDRATVRALSPHIANSLEMATAHALKLAEDNLWEAVDIHEPLLLAAGYAHRNLGSNHYFAAAVRHIALGHTETDWSPEERLLVQQYEYLSEAPLIGGSAKMQQLRSTLQKLAEHPKARVLLLGESGTGKEAAALMIHYLSSRHQKEFVPFNCASSNPQMLESAFRGHLKGAFTGADRDRQGLFERAHGSTLFLDEVGELPLESQATLLRILEDGIVVPMGGEGRKEKISPVDVRVIAATNQNLQQMVAERKFREDLYYRLSTVVVRMPALRDHLEDLPQICQDLWGRAERKGWSLLTSKQIRAFEDYTFPGNVRELANLLERAYILDIRDFERLLLEYKSDLGTIMPSENLTEPWPDALEEVKRLHINRVLQKYNNNIAQTAEALKVSRNTVVKYCELTE